MYHYRNVSAANEMKPTFVFIIFAISIVRKTGGDVILEIFDKEDRMAILNEECRSTLKMFVSNMDNSTEDNMWALQMWDASTKAPVGLMSYNFGEMGNFDQCLATKSISDNIVGKYCLGIITFTNNSRDISGNDTFLQREQKYWRKLMLIASAAPAGHPIWAICVPSNCSNEDVLNILRGMQPYGIDFEYVTCQTKDDYEPEFTADVVIGISILSVIFFIMILSTCYDSYCCFKGQGPAHPSLIAWSVYTNGGKLFQIEKKQDELSALNGIRVMSMLWIVVFHIRFVYSHGPTFNYKDFTDTTFFWVDVIFQSNVAVDTFLIIGGLLVSYVFFKQKRYEKNFNVLKHYLHRYIRLTPPVAGVIIISPLLKYMVAGPNWDVKEIYLENPCKKYWWSTLLYIQNYVNIERVCIIPSWYLDVDMQLFMFSPLILFLLVKRPKLAIAALVSASLAVIIAGLVEAYVDRLPGISYEDPHALTYGSYMSKFYFFTHFRAAPWLMGIILGFLLTRDNIKLVRIPVVLSALAWLVSFVVMTLCVFGAHTILKRPDQDRVGNAFYVALQRPAWSACIGWITWACATNRAGVINSFLSHELFQFLNQFTYSIYLLHFELLSMIVFSQKVPYYYSLMNVVYSTFGVLMSSWGLSVVWVLAFETPALVLDRIFLKNK